MIVVPASMLHLNETHCIDKHISKAHVTVKPLCMVMHAFLFSMPQHPEGIHKNANNGVLTWDNPEWDTGLARPLKIWILFHTIRHVTSSHHNHRILHGIIIKINSTTRFSGILQTYTPIVPFRQMPIVEFNSTVIIIQKVGGCIDLVRYLYVIVI